MATTALQLTGIKPTGSNGTRHGQESDHTHRRLRLCDIDVAPKVFPLPTKMNRVLMGINLAHGTGLEPDVEVWPEQVSHVLVSALSQHFGIEKGQMTVSGKKVVVTHSLTYDFYLVDFWPFLRLRYRAPKLYTAFASLLVSLAFPFIEDGENRYFAEHYFDWAFDMDAVRARKLVGRWAKGVRQVKQLRKVAISPKKALALLETYHPTKPIYKDIKTFLVDYLPQRFYFHEGYPTEYYTEAGEDPKTLAEAIYYGEVVEVYERIAMYCVQDDFFEEAIHQSMQDFANNSYLYSPCRTITKKKAETEIRDNIEGFETFNERFMDLAHDLTTT